MSFLDEHCIIFDNEDENKLEYTALHNVDYFQNIILSLVVQEAD